VEDLADQHLFAEWREIKMIAPAAVRSLKTRAPGKIVESIPPAYTMNRGHVTFFYNKLEFLKDRLGELTHELLQRDYKITNFDFVTDHYRMAWHEIPQTAWTPTTDDIVVNIARIADRLNQRPSWYRYYGSVKPPEFFTDLYMEKL
jgi:deoxyribonuclease (pyrimidine dimer)